MFDVFYFGAKPNLFEFEKYAASIDDAVAQCRTGCFWYIYGNNDYTGFDFSWKPAPWEADQTHVWGNQWQKDGEVYFVNASTHTTGEKNYHESPTVHRLPVNEYWNIPSYVDGSSIDWRWCPDPMEPPYIYAFSNQWNLAIHETTATYTVPNATQVKFVEDKQVRVLPEMDKWKIIHETDFDYSWRPNPKDPAYIYVFGNQWYPAERMPTVEYHMEGATERKFINGIQAKLPERHDNHWHTLVDCEWDYSWVPDPGDAPYIYVFGNQWHSANRMPTVEYHVKGATERKYMEYPRAKLLPTTDNWVVSTDVPFEFDFSWCPDPFDPPFIYVFGNQHWEGNRSATIEYKVDGATERKFVEDIKAVFDTLDIFFIDKGNPTAQSRFDLLKEGYPHAQKVRYANSMMDTIKRCTTRAKTARFWVISSEYSYDGFDFEWQPEPWQQGMTHVFPNQHQKWSDTFLINKWEFERHSKWANGLEQFPNLNFVTNQQTRKEENLWNMYYVDHGNDESEEQFKLLRKYLPDIIKTRAANDYLDVMKRIMTTADTEYVWILNSICNYDFFDFTWQPEPWQKEMIHCFSNGSNSNAELRGDTFYIHVESFKEQMIELELLDWFNVINYVTDKPVTRYPVPAVYYEEDDLIGAIKAHNFSTPYALFTQDKTIQGLSSNSTCLWTEKDRTVRTLTKSNSTSIVPRDVKKYLKTQLYDYPYLDKPTSLVNYRIEQPLDVVYISNGEPDAELWYGHMCDVLRMHEKAHQPYNRVHRVQNVNGRVAAYQAAAQCSTTPWFFAVFAKLEVSPNFDWNWQPDYWQGPKHYIFNALNPINGLEYGHMGMIAYNKRLVLENNAPGIDFTLSQPHESVPILSGTAHYNQDAWTTWRTAFREVLKLRLFMDTQPTLETEHRLNVWKTVGNGQYAGMSIQGAHDAIAYYEEVNGEYSELMKSFEWEWLRTRFNDKNL